MEKRLKQKIPDKTQQSTGFRIPVFVVPSLFLIGFLLRLLFVPNPGFEADITFWKSWGLAPFDHGLVWSMHNTNNNYPTPFAYLLWLITAIYSLFLNPHNFDQFWTNTNVTFLTLAKMPAILADMGIAAILYFLGKFAPKFGFPKLPQIFYTILAMLYLFSPISILDGALWGQVDSLGVIVYIAAALLAFSKRPFLAGMVYMLGLMTKLQNMIYGPLLFIFIWQDMGITGLFRAIAGSLLSFSLLNIEFLFARDAARIWASLTDNYDYFPLMSLNAYNIWWIVAGGNGMHVSDKLASIGIVNAKTVGLFLFIGGYLMATLSMAKNTLSQMFQNKPAQEESTGEENPERLERIGMFFIALILAASSFFLFQTESHDRYAFPIAIFFLFLMPFMVSWVTTHKEREVFWKTRIFKTSLIGYILYTGIYFLNMHTALIDNYPENGIPWLLFINTPSITIALSVLQLALFAMFVASMYKRISGGVILLSLLVPFALIGMKNLPLLTKKPVPLSSLTPYIASQDYGKKVNNMPTNASGGSQTWDRLSTQYVFYRSGIGTHAKSFIVYDINGKFSRFTSDVGIDTQAGGKSSVVFEVYGDDKLLYRSEVKKRYEFPSFADIPITGVKKLALVVQDGGDGISDDHADWLNAKLWP